MSSIGEATNKWWHIHPIRATEPKNKMISQAVERFGGIRNTHCYTKEASLTQAWKLGGSPFEASPGK
jgi:hypothetical protein